MVENMHDIPYLHTSQVGPEVTSVMSVVCREVKKIFTHGPVGVQVLAGANKEALAVAKAAGNLNSTTAWSVHRCIHFTFQNFDFINFTAYQ